MYKPYRKPIITALPDIDLPEPRIKRFVVFLIRFLGRVYLFMFYGVARILLYDDEVLLNAFKRALSGESRCIIAFRHPNGGEPQVLSWFFLFRLRAIAARKGIRFARWPHAMFIYGYEVARWGGWPVRFVMPNVGAMPIHHSKMDSTGMARIYKAITDSPWPVALAPEGQVSYTIDDIPRLESGVVRIGFQAVKQLEDRNINCPVEILPVSVHFRYGSWGKMNMEFYLRKIEKTCGITRKKADGLSFIERLRHCRDHILRINEKRYNIISDASISFEERLDSVINAALITCERMLDIKSEGDFFTRLYRVRHICWDKIYLPKINNLEKISQVERSALDISAGEAWYISRHQELADFGWYFRCPLPTEETAFHNKIEYIQNLWDFANRTMGGALSGRIHIFPRKVIIHASPAINLTGRLPEYKKNKKNEIASVLEVLKQAYINSIDKLNGMEKG